MFLVHNFFKCYLNFWTDSVVINNNWCFLNTIMSLQGPIGVAGESGLDGINGTKVNIKENINLSLKKI